MSSDEQADAIDPNARTTSEKLRPCPPDVDDAAIFAANKWTPEPAEPKWLSIFFIPTERCMAHLELYPDEVHAMLGEYRMDTHWILESLSRAIESDSVDAALDKLGEALVLRKLTLAIMMYCQRKGIESTALYRYAKAILTRVQQWNDSPQSYRYDDARLHELEDAAEAVLELALVVSDNQQFDNANEVEPTEAELEILEALHEHSFVGLESTAGKKGDRPIADWIFHAATGSNESVGGTFKALLRTLVGKHWIDNASHHRKSGEPKTHEGYFLTPYGYRIITHPKSGLGLD